MSSVPETRFTLPNVPDSATPVYPVSVSIVSAIWDWLFSSKKSTTDSSKESTTDSPKKSTTDSSVDRRPHETRRMAAKRCKPYVRTRPSHGWVCSDDGISR